MSAWLSSGPSVMSLPDHCTPVNDFLSRISCDFGTCVPTPQAFFSTLLGSLSIVSWLFAQLPQIFKNYKAQSTTGLSIYFLIEWCLGDSTNLLGALMTGQATWQVVVAGYYVCVDVILVSQYIWYTHYKAWREGDTVWEAPPLGGRGDDDTEFIEGISASDNSSERPSLSEGRDKPVSGKSDNDPKKTHFKNSSPRGAFSMNEKFTDPTSHRIVTRRGNSPPQIISPKTVLGISILCAALAHASPLHSTSSPLHTKESSQSIEIIGRLLSWTSTLLYLGSRLPQIFKNYSRRSTAGLSPALFIAAFFGNLFYSTSLITNPLAWASYPPFGLHGWVGVDGSDQVTWLKLAAPFWLGAAGVLALDGAIGIQFLMYSEEKVVVVKDGRGRGRWMRVSGWMRGWVPSPGPRREMEVDVDVVGDEGSGRPLLGERTRRDDGYGATT